MAKLTDVVKINSMVQGEVHEIGLARLPDECARCHQGIDPRFHFGTLLTRLPPKEMLAQLIYQCLREDCRQLFLALYKYVYRYEATSTLGSKDVFDLIDVGPPTPRLPGITLSDSVPGRSLPQHNLRAESAP